MTVSSYVDEKQLWQRHMTMAKIGGYGQSGVNRQAFSVEDNQARTLMSDWANEMQLTQFVDSIGNLFFRYQPEGSKGSPVVTGSHADSQPTGGRFDGIYGVLAGFEAINAIKQSGVTIKRPLEIVAWSNEEGSRFAPGAMGSMVFTGYRTLNDLEKIKDSQGIVLSDALKSSLAATPNAESRALKYPIAAYIEAHVEQGPVLEGASLDIGVVTDIQGCRWFEVEVLGDARHAGSTPLTVRRDALQGAHRIIEKLNQHFLDETDTTRFTVGRFELTPNSPNTVAERAVFTIDFRHPDNKVLQNKGDQILTIAKAVAQPCEVKVLETFTSAPVHFPHKMVEAIELSALKLELANIKMPSGAFHDAMFLAAHCPTGMIFVPSKGGVSHHPDEFTSAEELASGARVLSEALVSLANTI